MAGQRPHFRRGGNYRRQYTPTTEPTPPAPERPARKALQIAGDPDLWVTLQRVTDPNTGWTKTTRAMQTPPGVLINTCSRKTGSQVAAEALCLVPGVKLTRDGNGGWKVVPS